MSFWTLAGSGFIALLALFALLRSGWRAWNTTGRIGRNVIVVLAIAGVALVLTGALRQPLVWALLGPGIAAFTGIDCWILYQAMASPGLPSQQIGPSAIDAIESVVLEVAAPSLDDDDD